MYYYFALLFMHVALYARSKIGSVMQASEV